MVRPFSWNTFVAQNSLDSLIDDIKRRPAPYAALAAAGVAGALLLAGRNAYSRSDSSSTFGALDRQARRAIDSGLETAQRTLHGGADSLQGGVESLRERLGEVSLGREPTLSERTREAASNVGMSQSTVAVFIGTLLSKAVTGYLRLRADERARSQSQAVSQAQGNDFQQRLNALSEGELRAIAQDHGVRDAADRAKPELIEALNRA